MVVVPVEDFNQPPPQIWRFRPAPGIPGAIPPRQPFYVPPQQPPDQPIWFQQTNIAALFFVGSEQIAGLERTLVPVGKKRTDRRKSILEEEDQLVSVSLDKGVTIGVETPPAEAEAKLSQVDIPDGSAEDSDEEEAAELLFILRYTGLL